MKTISLTRGESGRKIRMPDIAKYRGQREVQLEIKSELHLDKNNLRELHFKFTTCAGSFDVGDNELVSFKGFPSYIGGSLNGKRNKFTSFEGITPVVANGIDLSSTKITNLVGIHNHLKSCKYLLINYNFITEGGLGLLMIDKLERIQCLAEDRSAPAKNSNAAIDIINKYLKSGRKSMLLCQQELIDFELEAYAQL